MSAQRRIAYPNAGGSSRPANAATLKEFSATEEGGALVEEWGDQAAGNLGIVRARVSLMLQSMSDDDSTAAAAWFDALPASQAKAVMRMLAGQ